MQIPDDPTGTADPAVEALATVETGASAPVETPSSPSAPISDLTAAPTPGGETPPAAVTPPVPPFQPPEGAKPFAYSLDGADMPLKGAVEADDWILVPKDTWHRDLRSNWFGNRAAWGRERATLQRQLQEAKTGQAEAASEEVRRARAITATWQKLTADPDAAKQYLDNWAVNGPLLREQAEREYLAAENQRLKEAHEARERDAQEAELIPQAQRALGATIEGLLAEPGFQGITADAAVDFLRYAWDLQTNGFQLFGDDGTGHWIVDTDRLRGLLTRELRAGRVEQQRQQVRQQTAAANQAAVAPTPPGTGPATPPARPKPAPPTTTATEPDHTTDPRKFDEWFRKLKVG